MAPGGEKLLFDPLDGPAVRGGFVRPVNRRSEQVIEQQVAIGELGRLPAQNQVTT